MNASTPDAVLQQVRVIQRALTRVLRGRVLLQALGAGVVGWLLTTLRQPGVEGTRATGPWWAWSVALLCSAVAAATLWRRHGRVTIMRAALWVEEHGGSGYALVTWIEQCITGLPPSPMLAAVVAASSERALSSSTAALRPLIRRQLLGPALFLAGALTIAILRGLLPTPASLAGADATGASGTSVTNRALPIAPWRVRITPPSYSGLPARTLGDTTSVRVLSGTRIELLGRDAPPDSVRVRALVDPRNESLTGLRTGSPVESRTGLQTDAVETGRNAALETTGEGWRSVVIATDAPMEVRVMRAGHARLLLVEGVADSIPRVTLTMPARDSVLRRAEGRLPLAATLHDDLGMVRASFEVVISSGEGERFTVRTLTIGARDMQGIRDGVLQSALDLAVLALGPGDVVHLRAMARDAHPAAARESGTSETRSFRIARPSEYDSVAVEPAPPPEVDKSLLSQRMLLMLTERLEARRPRISAEVLGTESRALARDQGRLRQAVGDAVFQRLSGEAGGEHSHSADDGHDHGVEAVGGKLALSGVNAQGMLEEGDDAPVIAINKPLLEAYNAMWDAGRALEQADPRAAIPFMRVALEAIERARSASRLYLRGRPPTVIIDLAKVRLVGKDTGAPADRAAREALPSRAAAREARLMRAATLVSRDAAAARDSLAVLRLESLADAPSFAQALAVLLEAFATSGTVDVTEPFLRARRVLGGVERVPDAAWSRGGPP